jgi:hypothetical protein
VNVRLGCKIFTSYLPKIEGSRKIAMTRFMKSLNMNFNNGLINKRILSLWMAFLLVLVIGPAYATTFLKDFDGAIHSLDEYTGQGKWAIVMIWASDCHACNQEAER